MDLSTFVKTVKRQTSHGRLTVTNDQATKDIIDSLNARGFEAWRRHDWEFSLLELSITLVADQKDYTLDATAGSVIVLYGNESGLPLKRFTHREHLRWWRNFNGAPGTVFGYVHIGRVAATGAIKIRMVNTPGGEGTILGWAKMKLVPYVVADIATNTGLTFFPEEFHNTLLYGVKSDIYEIQGKKDLGLVQDRKYSLTIGQAIIDEEGSPDAQLTSPPPPMYRKRQRTRGGTIVS